MLYKFKYTNGKCLQMSVFSTCLGTVGTETYEYLSILCEALETVSTFETIAMPLATVCVSKLLSGGSRLPVSQEEVQVGLEA